MADSVVEILNTTLTSTELPDSSTSYDLITTDANTSYVIKDVQVQMELSNLDAEINNFPIGSFAQDLSGSEVVDVSSTLSVKSSNFPVSVEGIWWGNYEHPYQLSTETIPFLNTSLKDKNASHDLESLADLGFSNFDGSQGTNVINSLVLSSDKTKLFQMRTTGNNVQTFRYWATPQGSYTNLSGNYMPMWYLPHKESIYYRNGNELNAINVETGTITTIGSSLLGFGGNSWSSYTRWTSNGDWLFYMKSASYKGTYNANNATIWATNVTNAVTLEFTACGGVNDHSTGTKIGVSYDKATDYYYIYRNDVNSSAMWLLKDRLPITKSQMDAYTSNTSISTNSLKNYKSYNTFTLIDRSDYFDTFTGHPTEGNKFYRIDSGTGVLKEVDWDAETDETVYTKENSGTKSFLTTYPLSTADATELFGSDPASIKIRITGVKTTS